MDEVRRLIERHEPEAAFREQHYLGFEGFAAYLLDKENFAFTPELLAPDERELVRNCEQCDDAPLTMSRRFYPIRKSRSATTSSKPVTTRT